MYRLRAFRLAPVSLLVLLVGQVTGVVATHADVLHLRALLLGKAGLIFAAGEILNGGLFLATVAKHIILALFLSLDRPLFGN